MHAYVHAVLCDMWKIDCVSGVCFDVVDGDAMILRCGVFDARLYVLDVCVCVTLNEFRII